MLKNIKKIFLFSILSAFIGSTGLVNAQNISGAGASFPAEVYNYWLARYNKDTGKKVSYQAIGSGGGIKQIKSRLIDFGASDEALDSKELQKENLYQFPTVIGAIAVVFNIKGIKDNELKLSNEVVSNIFLGKIKKWDDKSIQDLNPNLKLPSSNIKIVYRSDGSGTTYNFTEWLSKISKEWEKDIGTGKSIDWKSGVGIKGNDGVTQFVKQTNNSISYVELSYKKGANLTAAQLQSAKGDFVAIDDKTLNIAASGANFSADKDFKTSLILLDIKDAYPIVNATFILLPKDSKNLKAVKEFFEYTYKNGDQDALSLGFVPLSDKTKSDILKYLKN